MQEMAQTGGQARFINWRRNAFLFILSQVFSIFGSSIVQYCIIWHITLTTQSGLYAAVSILCNLLPMFLLMPFVGVWADRFNRKWIINLADGGMALVALAVALLYLAGLGNVYVLLGALLLRAFGGAVQNPCVNAMIPEFVPPEKLTRVNSLYTTSFSMVQMIAPALAAALLGLVNFGALFFVDVITASLAIALLGFGLRLPKRQKPTEGQNAGSYVQDMKQGLLYIGRTPFLRHLFLYLAACSFLCAPVFYLSPLFVTRSFGGEVWYLSAVEITLTGGMLLGGVLMASWGGFRNKLSTIVFGGCLMAAASLLMGAKLSVWVFLAAIVVFGLGNAIYSTPATVLMQTGADERYIGRVFSAYAMLNTGVLQIGMLVFGPLADVLDICWLLLGCGGALFLASLLLVRSHALRLAGQQNTQNTV